MFGNYGMNWSVSFYPYPNNPSNPTFIAERLIKIEIKLMSNFKYGDLTEKIIGAAFRVHNTLGNGFQEVIYQRALELEFGNMQIDYAREFEMPIF